MNKRYFLIILLITGLFASCKKEQGMIFDDIARIQFGQSPAQFYKPQFDLDDTLKTKTFVYDPEDVVRDTVYFDIYTLGKVSESDRSFTIKQEEIPGVNNAVAGKHYVAFDDPSVKDLYVIKAGTAHSKVPVIVLREPSLKDTSVKLKMVIAPDENFQPGEPAKLWRRVEFSDQLTMPNRWPMMEGFFGKYSKVKHQFFIDVTGEKWDDELFDEFYASISLMNYYRTVVKTALVDYNNAHPGKPLTDEDGDAVIIP